MCALRVPGQENGNITRRLSTNIRPKSMQEPSLDGVIKSVSVNWKELVNEDANTLEAALALMDTSSIGKARYQPRFDSLKQELRGTLQYHVDANYQGFNTSIGSYRSVVQSITDSQKSINEAREDLIKTRDGLGTRRPALKDLRANSLKYSAMIDILDKIEELKGVPDKLESQISQKLFLSANETLNQANRLAESKELESITALQHTKSYLKSQQSSLFSILIEELHNHVYLKSPYCDSRWSAYTHENDEFSNVEQVLEDKIKFDLSEKSSSFSGSAQLDEFLEKFDREQPMVEDQKVNIEADAFSYIRLIIESLAEVNRLPQAFDLIHQRISTELHKIVDKTIGEVAARYPQSVREHDSRPTAGFLDDGYMSSDIRLAVLKDLTWTLYSKLIAVLQGHRVIFEVADAIGTRRPESAVTYELDEVFKIIRSEIRSLLYSYITDKSNSTQQSKIAFDRMRVPNGKAKRDTTRKLFSLEKVDYNNPEFQKEYSILQGTLEKTLPGLASNAYSDKDRDITPYAPTDLSAAHRLLIAPNVFNIRVMLDPTVMFLQKARQVFPNRIKKSSEEFIEEFLVNAFLPQLEDSLSLSFHKIMTNSDATQIDLQWQKLSKYPILKGASSFMTLVRKTCRLLNTGYLYREKYADLVISLIQWLVRLFEEKFEGLVILQEDAATTTKPKRLAAMLSLDSDVRPILKKLLDNPRQVTDDLIRQELVKLLSKRKPVGSAAATASEEDKEGIARSDLLDIGSYKMIALMCTSLRWIVAKLKALRKIDNEDETSAEDSKLDTKLKKRWTLMEANRAVQLEASADRDHEALILKGDSLYKFDQAVGKLEFLADTCIMTLRSDLLSRVIYYVDRSMTEGDYFTDYDAEERDALIGQLDNDMIKADEAVSGYLLPQDRLYYMLGLPRFINESLVLCADRLNYMNINGIKKMRQNIIALQQLLKSIVPDPQQVDFKRSLEFYNKFPHGPGAFIDQIKSNDVIFSYEECKILLRLMHNESIRKFELSNRRDAANQSRVALTEQLQELHRHFYSGG